MLTFCLHCFYSYFYPMKYKEEIEMLGQEYDVKSALIASVVNSESGFNESAQSSKGACGIMQIMPTTAEWVALKIGKEYSQEKLFDVKYNLEIGTYYLSYLIKYFNDEKLAICAYNAGQGNVSNWLKNEEYSSDGKSLFKIPFKETEDYLNKVYKNYNYYLRKYKS